jgi:hypothetical protein
VIEGERWQEERDDWSNTNIQNMKRVLYKMLLPFSLLPFKDFETLQMQFSTIPNEAQDSVSGSITI